MNNGHLNENRLLVLIGSNHLASAPIKETIITIIQGKFDWHYFLKKSRSSGLAPLIYQNLASIETIKEYLPSDIWKGLKDTYYATVATNLLIEKQLNKIIESFSNEQGIKMDEVVEKSGLGEEAEQILNELLKEGEIYQPKPQYLKLLE